MADPVSIYLTVLFIGIALTIVVGQILIRSGRPYLEDAFPRPGTASSVTGLVVVLFHLIVLGVIALVVSVDITLAHPLQTIVVRTGLVLLVLGAAYGATLLMLARLRARRRQQLLIDERTAQLERMQQPQSWSGDSQQSTGNYSAAQTYPVNETEPGR